MRIDMHVHTSGSFDSLSDPQAVVRRAREVGLDRICVTDHDVIDVALALRDEHPEFVIAGEEVKTAERVDIIGLYLSELIPGGTPARETCERIRAQGGIVYVPHPFAGGKGGGGRALAGIADLVDVVEGFNARVHRHALNERATAWARARDLPVGAGSDAHTLGEVGRAWAEVPAFVDGPAGLLQALRHGSLHGTSSARVVHVASTWAKIRKWTR
jgi:predicted metal-dependent phosphoesterase TrpH